MSGKERTVRLVLGVAFVCVGLWILNYSYYSFLIAGGPPTNYPEIWYQEGIISGWRALAVLTLAVLVQFRCSTLRRSRVSWGLVFAIVMGLSYPHVREYLLIDSCLDSGGAWNEKHFRCET